MTITKISHVDSLWKRDWAELKNGLLKYCINSGKYHQKKSPQGEKTCTRWLVLCVLKLSCQNGTGAKAVIIFLQVCEEFKAIARVLYDKPNSIEELSEQREYMKQIPEKLKKNQELIDKAMVDYELIEEFNYSISAEDFNAK